MKWSKLKSLVEQRFSKRLAGRISIYSTRYGNCTCGRAWLTLDGEEIANFCTRAYFKRRLRSERGLPSDTPAVDDSNVPFGYGEFTRQDAYRACWAFLHDLSIDQAIADPDPLVQALAVLDSRIGKQRLSQLDATKMHPLVQELLRVRLVAEGLPVEASVDTKERRPGHRSAIV